MNIAQPVVKEPESVTVVRFQDCDPFGHLNNARYIDYFFNAREDQLASVYDFHIFEHGKALNQNWVVSKTQIAYLYPALIKEEVVIKTRLVHFTDSTIVIEAIMLDKAKQHPKAVGWTEFTYVSLATGRRTNHPDDIMQFIKQVWVEEDFQADGFNHRIEAIKGKYRAERHEASTQSSRQN